MLPRSFSWNTQGLSLFLIAQKITTDGAFKEGANLDPNFLLVGSGAETIEGGAEGELQASSAIPSAGQRRGELVDVVDRKFAVTDRPEDLVHTLLMSGTWTGLRTSDVEGAFYNLFILYTDEVFEIVDDRMIRRAILSGDNTESGRRNQAPKSENISLDKSQPLRLLQGDYLLRSTVTYTASYERAGWILNLRDQIFGPQGVGSGGDMRGFQSRLTPPEVLPPPTPIPEPSTI